MPEEPGQYSNYPHPVQPVNGTLILVLGILSVTVCGCLSGIPAWIMGNNALASIRAGIGDPKEEQLVNVGRILGMISVGLGVCGCLWYMVVLGTGLGTAGLRGR